MSGEQLEAFPAGSVPRPTGPVEAATLRALEAAQLDPRDVGSGAALVALAWALDASRAAGKFYGVAQAGPPYLEQARALGLTLDSRKGAGGESDPVAAWLAGLTSPTVEHPTDA